MFKRGNDTGFGDSHLRMRRNGGFRRRRRDLDPVRDRIRGGIPLGDERRSNREERSRAGADYAES